MLVAGAENQAEALGRRDLDIGEGRNRLGRDAVILDEGEGRQGDPRDVAAALVEIESAEGEVDDVGDLPTQSDFLAELPVEDPIGLQRRVEG